MDIKQFVKESVSQIVEAINESNPKLQSIGSFIPTGGMIGEGVLFSANSEPSKDANKENNHRHFLKVDYDLAVTVSTSTTSNAGVRIKIAVLGAESTYEESNQNQCISRIKFMIPIALPKQEAKEER